MFSLTSTVKEWVSVLSLISTSFSVTSAPSVFSSPFSDDSDSDAASFSSSTFFSSLSLSSFFSSVSASGYFFSMTTSSIIFSSIVAEADLSLNKCDLVSSKLRVTFGFVEPSFKATSFLPISSSDGRV